MRFFRSALPGAVGVLLVAALLLAAPAHAQAAPVLKKIVKCAKEYDYLSYDTLGSEPFSLDPLAVASFAVHLVKKRGVSDRIIHVTMKTGGDKERRSCHSEFYFTNPDRLATESLRPVRNWPEVASPQERAALEEKFQECRKIQSRKSSGAIKRRMNQRYGTVFWRVPGYEESGGGPDFIPQCRYAVGSRTMSFLTPGNSRITIIEDRIFLNGEQI